ncbi:MAG: hypothetical protein L6Q97_17035, partial [Thermoanaerobaculia bacterium]|nr:hypothetical protein [Thermoanaerobaculia bacterium]
MKKTTFSLLLLLSCCWLAAQCPTADITFSTQGQVDSFPINYPGCTDFPGNMTIRGDGITNLNGLLGITSVKKNLIIGKRPDSPNPTSPRENAALENLIGLDNLHKVGILDIANNAVLKNLDGLENLSNVSHLFLIRNDSLRSIGALKKLDTIPGHL